MAEATAQIKVYPDAELTAQDFAMLIERLSTEASGIIYGCGVTPKPNSNNTLIIASGWCLVRGRLIYITTGEATITLPSTGSATHYLYVEVNLGDSATPAKISNGSTLPVDNELFNQNSSYSYLELGRFLLTNTGITNLQTTPLMNRPPKRNNTITKMHTDVYDLGSTAVTEFKLVTVDKVNSLLGINLTGVLVGTHIDAQDYVSVSAFNAHWEANRAKICGISYRANEKAWYVHFLSAVTGRIRINMNVTYTPDLL